MAFQSLRLQVKEMASQIEDQHWIDVAMLSGLVLKHNGLNVQFSDNRKSQIHQYNVIDKNLINWWESRGIWILC